jgi:hypothetical protein
VSNLSECVAEHRLQELRDAIAEAVNSNAAELISAVSCCETCDENNAAEGLEEILAALEAWAEYSEKFLEHVAHI